MPRAMAEALEPRRLLSHVSPAGAASDPEPPMVGTEGARYVRRIDQQLGFWASADGSGFPYALLPQGAELALGGTEGDDLVTIDMGGGDIVAGRLTIVASGGDDRVRLINGDGRVLSVDGVPALNGKTLDLGVADLRVRGASASGVELLVGSARNGGTVRWQGAGIGTSAATAVTGLAPVQQGADVLVKYTYDGDVNGDGKVNADDYFRIDMGCPFLGSIGSCVKPTYAQGDLNFDDIKNADDYFLIDYAFLEQGEPLGAAAAVAAGSDGGLDVEDEARYLKRVGDDLALWASADGSGEPIATIPLPVAGDITLGGSTSDDMITMDMSGGDIVIEGTLAIAADAGSDVIRVVNGDGRLLTIGRVELNGGKLDLGTGDLIIRDADVRSVEDLLRTARRGSVRWQGAGIGTSAAAGTCTGLAPRSNGGGVTVRYTYEGDVNHDGRLNADDYFRIDLGFLEQHADPTYFQGDINFDDKVDADDYWVIDDCWRRWEPFPL